MRPTDIETDRERPTGRQKKAGRGERQTCMQINRQQGDRETEREIYYIEAKYLNIHSLPTKGGFGLRCGTSK